jgi:hypothetical protein
MVDELAYISTTPIIVAQYTVAEWMSVSNKPNDARLSESCICSVVLYASYSDSIRSSVLLDRSMRCWTQCCVIPATTITTTISTTIK